MYSKWFSALTIPHMFWDRKGSHSILIFTSQGHVLASYTLKNVCLRELLWAFPFIATFSWDSWAAEVTRKRCIVRALLTILTMKYSGGRLRIHRYMQERAMRSFYFRLPLAIRFLIYTGSVLDIGRKWEGVDVTEVVWKKAASTLLFGRWFLFPLGSCFSLTSPIFFSTSFLSAFFISSYTPAVRRAAGIQVNGLRGIKVHFWRRCPATKLPGATAE